jgi:hypothetical protein
VVRVFCNIHPTMSAVILVLKTPYFAVTGTSGAFEIPNVPPGEYYLRVFHERASASRLKTLERKVEVDSTGSVALEPFVISETGYLHVPHKDKYGHDYPPAADDGGFYPGGRK